ncbi:hypothetical protein [Neptuniibacter sp.]|uniref:hypothetical protein n=1 Tax=Neptuniibacter sp. TaxID=1962643 RepID=UPI002607978E|nr:hypothetical protein [Neptuniibacter sp.]MCP4595355.1 hypothetical protein [Neptuniibacter sp.]
MSKGNKEANCSECSEALIAQNKELWAKALQQIGDSNNAEWCAICDQLFVQNNSISPHHDEIEITFIDP